jgi:hypothetical protein
MYLLKEIDKIKIINQSQLSIRIGFDKATLNRIFKRKQKCSKLIAYAIVKTINENAEIEDYFEKVK